MTPKLDQVLQTAGEVGGKDAQIASDFRIQLEKGKIQKAKYQEMTRYLEQTLTQRKELAQRLEKEEEARKIKENEFKHKRELLAEFPVLMQKLEDASIPLQDYLDVKITKNAELSAIVGKLPTALQTVYKKLKIFSDQYPQFNLQVMVNGDE